MSEYYETVIFEVNLQANTVNLDNNNGEGISILCAGSDGKLHLFAADKFMGCLDAHTVNYVLLTVLTASSLVSF